MFLSTTQDDFNLNRTSQLLSDFSSEECATVTSNQALGLSTEKRQTFQQSPRSKHDTYQTDIPPRLWTLQLSSAESHLWTYFHKAIAPTCVLNPAINPYQDVILRIAAFTGNTSPLFHAIMAISASQLHILGNLDFYPLSWDYRQRALRSLRQQTTKIEQGTTDKSLEAQILATVMAMVFLDVSFALPG